MLTVKARVNRGYFFFAVSFLSPLTTALKSAPARNPSTGATIKVPRSSVPKFRAGADFKAVVNGDKKLTAKKK